MQKRNFILGVIAAVALVIIVVAGSWIAFYHERAATDARHTSTTR